jgi:hypothetical protein
MMELLKLAPVKPRLGYIVSGLPHEQRKNKKENGAKNCLMLAL